MFDKTGTLTVGKPVLQGVDVLGTANRDECLGVAVALESASAHPLARAFADAAGAQDAPSALGVTEAPGLGLEGRVGGQLYRIGNLAYVQGIAGSLRAPTRDDSASDDGASAVFLGSEDQWLARFVIADALRADARDVVRYFQDAGKTVLLVSGDADQVAQDIGRQLGVDSAQGDALPAQKLDMVQALQRAGAVVAMVGDGINDAAVLGAADVSFAMGCGAPLAQIHADAVLLSGRLSSLSDTAATARATMSVIRQNLCWAMLYNVVAIPAAALGLITPWLSGVGMAASSALVVANAWRLRRARAR